MGGKQVDWQVERDAAYERRKIIGDSAQCLRCPECGRRAKLYVIAQMSKNRGHYYSIRIAYHDPVEVTVRPEDVLSIRRGRKARV